MKLLDLFCGAGGAAMGYHRSGFEEIVGVDIKTQPRYPFTLAQADALEYVGVYGHGGHTGKHRMLYRKEAAVALGIDWMTRDEMTQSIPPAYTEFIGRQLLAHLTDSRQRA